MNMSVEYRLMQASIDVERIIDEKRKEHVFNAMMSYFKKEKIDKEVAEQEFLDEVLHIEREAIDEKERFMEIFHKAMRTEKEK